MTEDRQLSAIKEGKTDRGFPGGKQAPKGLTTVSLGKEKTARAMIHSYGARFRACRRRSIGALALPEPNKTSYTLGVDDGLERPKQALPAIGRTGGPPPARRGDSFPKGLAMRRQLETQGWLCRCPRRGTEAPPKGGGGGGGEGAIGFDSDSDRMENPLPGTRRGFRAALLEWWGQVFAELWESLIDRRAARKKKAFHFLFIGFTAPAMAI